MRARLLLSPVVCLLLAAFAVPDTAEAGRRRRLHESPGSQTFASPQSNPVAVCASRNRVFVAATTSNRVDVIDTTTSANVGHVPVGVEPVGLAVKPGAGDPCGSELWVTNHVSDSVSVVDIEPASASYLQVVETVQAVDPDSLVTAFDEPVGIAFQEDGARAFVTLSSLNQVAVIDTAAYAVTQTLAVNAQDPRAIAVRNGRLYVAAFESDNGTELSSCGSTDGTEQCTLDPGDAVTFAQDPNLPGLEVHIVADPDRPDRDLFVWDTADLAAAPAVVEGVGTLLYGLAVADDDTVYVTQADARNAVNGDDLGFLVDLDNRMFLNRVAVVGCAGGSCGAPVQRELDPPVGSPPAPGTQLATPFGVALSGDGSVLVGTAAGSSRIFSMDTASGAVLDRLDVGAIPFGIAFDSSGATGTAYVLNTLDNSVSVVTVGAGGTLSAGATVPVGDDPTPDAVRRGRIAFNDANGSTEGTFSCASCHPFGNTDQLIWRIGGQCVGCEADEPRTTMPIRGLRDSVPLHWDGTLGDPFGGPNGAGTTGSNCVLGDADGAHDCFRNLVEGSLSGVMCDQTGSCPTCDLVAGTCPPGALLSHTERDDMAFFLEAVSYPPARLRRGDDAASGSALAGFGDFFLDNGGIGGIAGVSTCADSTAGCHEFPLGTATNSQTVGEFDAPTLRGLNDRFVQFSNGITGSEEFVSSQGSLGWTPAQAMSEFAVFDAAFPGLFTPAYNVGPDDIFQMVEESSTGHSGAFARQVTLNTVTTAGCSGPGTCDAERMLDALEAADAKGLVNLRGHGLSSGAPIEISYEQDTGVYRVGSVVQTRSALLDKVQTGIVIATLTGHLRSTVSATSPQPLLAPVGANCNAASGGPFGGADPVLPSGSSFTVEAKHVAAGDAILVDGQLLAATVTAVAGSPACPDAVADQLVSLDVSELGLAGGVHLLQVRNGAGLLSNELPFTP